MDQPTRYREIDVAGPPFEMGRQIGEAAREEIRGFAAVALERVNKTVSVSRDRALGLAAATIEYVAAYSLDMLEELRGTASGSGIGLDELVLLHIRNQLLTDADAGCTAVAAGPSAAAHSQTLLGQNWDNDPVLDPFTIVLTRRPEGKPALMNITQAGLIAYIGLNSEGLGVCLNSLPAPSRELGVPHYFTVRGIYECDSLQRAVQAVDRAQRAIAANILLVSPEGPADLEVTIDEVHVLRDAGSGLLTHTNHCLHPDLVAINDDFPDQFHSGLRKRRIDQLLAVRNGPLNLDLLKQALKDHENHPTSICRHPNDHLENGFWTTVFSVVIEADAGRMHISRGNPCEQPYETYRMA